MRQDIELTSFSKGELSPRLKGRTDYKGYFDGCETMFNMVVMPQGGATRRPGTIYAANVKDQAHAPKLIRFQFSVTQSYMLEFGEAYVRVYKDRAQIINIVVATGMADNGAGLIRVTVASTGGLYTGNTATITGTVGTTEANGTWVITVISGTTFDLVGSAFVNAWVSGGSASIPVEVPTIYGLVDIPLLAHTQSTDTLYLVCPARPIYTLTRLSHTVWTYQALTIFDGPYYATNTTATTLTPSATTGAITITASAVTGINDGDGFKVTDIGRSVRILHTHWGWAIITGFTSTTVVNATVQEGVTNGAQGSFDSATASAAWKLGKWSGTTGYPWLTTFWQQRLFFLGTDSEPNAVEGSQVGDYQSFSPTKADATVIDTNAVSWVIADEEVNAVRWVSGAGSAVTPQLGIGTEGAEHVLQAGGSAQALTPTSVQVYRESTLGGRANASALRVGKSVLFAGQPGRKLYEWTFNWQVSGYVGVDKTVEAEHITRGGIGDIAYQKQPYGVVWCRLTSGGLVGMTYLPEQEVLAWHHHQLGGSYYGGQPVVESIATMPSSDNSYDELWLSVLRIINNAEVRTIEVMDRYFDDQLQEDGVFMDCSLQSDLTFPTGQITVSAVTGAGVTFTATSGTPFGAGNVGSLLRYRGGVAVITGFTSTTVITGTWYRDAASVQPANTGEWSLTATSSSFSGLSHLEGQTVQILGDGSDFGTGIVASGSVTLDASRGEASYATIGLPTTYRLVTMPWAVQQTPSGAGRFKTVPTLFIRLLSSLGCAVGRQVTDSMTDAVEDKFDTIVIRSAGDPVGFAPPLYTGIRRLPLPGSHDMEGQMLVAGSGPYPCTVLALLAIGDTGEMPGQ